MKLDLRCDLSRHSRLFLYFSPVINWLDPLTSNLLVETAAQTYSCSFDLRLCEDV